MTTELADPVPVLIDELVGADDPFAKIVHKRVVRDGIEWYQKKKRRRRRAHHATLAAGALVTLGLLAFSVVAARSSDQPELQIPTGASGVLLGGITYARSTADFRKHWRTWTDAQEELEHDLSEWEVAMADAAVATSSEQAHEIKKAATNVVLARSRATRAKERTEFFGPAQSEAGLQSLLTAHKESLAA